MNMPDHFKVKPIAHFLLNFINLFFIKLNNLTTFKTFHVIMMIMAKNNACGVCGRRGKRDCPAVEGVICPACCGANRGGHLDCPPDCTSYPFGTEAYDLWLRVDGSWFRQIPSAIRPIMAVGCDWRRVLPAWFKCIAATGGQDEYAGKLLAIVDGFVCYDRDRFLKVARRTANPDQRKALDAATSGLDG